MIYTGLNNTSEVEAVYAAKRVTTTGTPPLSYPSKGYDLEDFLISGNTIQNGTPTPEAPVDVVGCGARTENLLNNDSIVSGGWAATAGTEPTPISNPKRCRYNHFFAVASKTILYDFKDLSVNIVMMNSDGLSLGGTGFLSGVGSVTFLSNTEKISLIIANSDSTEDITEDYARSKNISLDYGYKLPITVNGAEFPIYLGEAPTTRQIKKLVLTGGEYWTLYNGNYYSSVTDGYSLQNMPCRCTHTAGGIVISNDSVRLMVLASRFTAVASNLEEWKSYLAAQYAAGTPVTIWYVLADSETGIVNEPLMKIGDYADTISLSQSGITVPTTVGTNTITTETTVLPSNISVTTPEKEVTEVYAGINYQNPVYYKSRIITGQTPLSYKALSKPLSDYLIYGNTMQDGTPTPEAPVDVVGCGVRTGNLLNYTTAAGGPYTTVTQISGGISVSGSYYAQFKPVQFIVGRTYTMSWKADTISGTSVTGWRFQYAGNTYSSLVSNGSTLTAEKKVTQLLLYVSTGEKCVVEFTEIMLNEGSTALPYEPYGYKLPILSGGGNLFDTSKVTLGKYINAQGVETDSTARTPVQALNHTDYIEIQPNTNYTYHYKFRYGVANTIALCWFDASKNIISRNVKDVISSEREYTLTSISPTNAVFCIINFTGYIPNESMELSFNLGSTALPYEPYIEPTESNIYIGKAQTTRQIKKLVLTGEENWMEAPYAPIPSLKRYVIYISSSIFIGSKDIFCTHYVGKVASNDSIWIGSDMKSLYIADNENGATLSDWKFYLAAQYAAGTPVTVWYILANEETAVVNEPLMKIGDYADTITMTQAGVTILTVAGVNVLTVDTTVQLSEVNITGNIKPII